MNKCIKTQLIVNGPQFNLNFESIIYYLNPRTLIPCGASDERRINTSVEWDDPTRKYTFPRGVICLVLINADGLTIYVYSRLTPSPLPLHTQPSSKYDNFILKSYRCVKTNKNNYAREGKFKVGTHPSVRPSARRASLLCWLRLVVCKARDGSPFRMRTRRLKYHRSNLV